MSERIHVLDETTANKIAAGEVIERPASVVKELVENSIDAGSTRIEVEVEEGGLLLIRVTDNGHGMSRRDAQLCLARHATSKIQFAEDLNVVTTLGFRGEAIPSIASVSHFTLITRRQEDLEGTQINVDGGTIGGVMPVGCPMGTMITVRDLFYNTPARLKYLKTTATEIGHISDILGRLSLAYPKIAFRLQHNNRQLLFTTGGGDTKETMASIYGAEIARQLLPVDGGRNDYRILGFIAKPSTYRKNRNYQNIFVNGRLVRSRVVSRAIENGYQSTLPSGAYPIASLLIDVPSGEVDVNVHPTKSEVRFLKEKDIFLLVYHAVKGALEDACLIPNIDINKDVAATVEYSLQPLPLNHYAINTPVNNIPTGNIITSVSNPAFQVRELDVNQAVHSYDTTLNKGIINHERPQPVAEGFPLLQPIGQIDNTYIVAQGVEGMYLIDQHAAHERILFNRMLNKRQVGGQQTLLVPWLWEMTMQEAVILRDHLSMLQDLGFNIEDFGQHTFRVCAVPVSVPITIIDEILNEFLAELTDTYHQQPTHKKRDLLLVTAACKAAIKAHARLTMQEMLSLIQQLAETEQPYTCPHGRPTVIHISAQELAKRFKRIQ